MYIYIYMYVCVEERPGAGLSSANWWRGRAGGERLRRHHRLSMARVIPTNLFDCTSMLGSPRRNKIRPSSSLPFT